MNQQTAEVLKEFVHELAALYCLQSLAKKKQADLDKPDVLHRLKQELKLTEKLAVTHIVDILVYLKSRKRE